MKNRLLAGLLIVGMLLQPMVVLAETMEQPETDVLEMETDIQTDQMEEAETAEFEAEESEIITEETEAEATEEIETEAEAVLDPYYADDPQYEREMAKQYAAMPAAPIAMDYEHDERFKNHTVRYGIDVSSYQEDIDWAKAKADGVEFAIIRAGFRGWGKPGNLVKDLTAIKNIEEAQALGIKVGVYIYSQAITEAEARQEVDFVKDIIAGHTLDLPLVMDFEYAYVNGAEGGRLYDAHLSVQEATNVCLAFCDYAGSLGFEPMVYANKSTLTNNLNANAISSKYKIWLAHYTNKTSYAGDYSYWQYSESISVDGIVGPVDGDFWYEPGKSSGIQTLPTDKLAEPVLMIGDAYFNQSLIQWEAVEGVDWYVVYRRKDGEDKWTNMGNTTKTMYVDNNFDPDTTYYYTVRGAYTEPGIRYLGPYDKIGIRCKYGMAAPIISSVFSGANSSFGFKWNRVTDAEGYLIYRRTAGETTWTRIAWTENLSYKDTDLKTGVTYQYTVKGFHRYSDGSLFHGEFDRTGVEYTYWLDVPVIKDVSAVNYKSAQITWNGVKNAAYYYVYRKAGNGSYVRLAEVTGTSYVDKTCATGTKYTYTVRAVGYDDKGKALMSSYIDSKAVTPTLDLPIMRNTKVMSDGLKTGWYKVAGAEGYYVYRRTTNGKWSKIAAIKGGSNLYYTDTTAEKGIRYYYVTSAYKKVDGKIVEGGHRQTGVSNIR